jgi:enamine deaminase RidA (YjgF/YER057c/UK114 family)
MGANAQTSVPAFTSGQVLTAAQVTQINTGIPVFASSTERDAAFGGTGEKTLAEGQMAYLEDTNETQYYDGSSWAAVGAGGGKILQVVSTTKVDDFSMSSGTLADITGLSVSITPTDATSTVLVVANVHVGADTAGTHRLQLVRDSTAIASATDASVSNNTFSTNFQSGNHSYPTSVSFAFEDSPATTSATTYKIQTSTSGGTIHINAFGPQTINYGGISTITAFEVSA